VEQIDSKGCVLVHMIATHQLPLSVIARNTIPRFTRNRPHNLVADTPGKYGGRKIEGGGISVRLPRLRLAMTCGVGGLPGAKPKMDTQKLHPLWLLFTCGSSVILTLRN